MSALRSSIGILKRSKDNGESRERKISRGSNHELELFLLFSGIGLVEAMDQEQSLSQKFFEVET